MYPAAAIQFRCIISILLHVTVRQLVETVLNVKLLPLTGNAATHFTVMRMDVTGKIPANCIRPDVGTVIVRKRHIQYVIPVAQQTPVLPVKRQQRS